MASESPIWERAERDLVTVDPQGSRDVWLWEHSKRVANNARRISALPDTPTQRLDPVALEAAALYHEAGWVCQYRQGLITRFDIMKLPTSEEQHEAAARLMAESLRGLLKPRTIETAALVLRQLDDRIIRAPETRILADADSLDEFGVLALCETIHRQTLDGQGIDAILLSWQRRREFGYWKARIGRSIHSEAVKCVAIQRIEQLDQFMSLLDSCHTGEDLSQAFQEVLPEAQ
ncbi:MAG: HD domain-containing protein [bacterium]|nr:HD domain-containing protein [bacterium]